MAAPEDRSLEPPEGDTPERREDGASRYVVIGRIAAARGLRGEMRVNLADPDGAQFLQSNELYLGEDHLRVKVLQARLFRGQGLLQAKGIDDRDAAEYWRDAPVYAPADQVAPLNEGEYYYRQIRGLSVVTDKGEDLGRITDVLSTGANDVYVVQGPNGEEILLPAIKEVILKIELDRGIMSVRLLEGLRD